MDEMRADMGGAACVVATIKAAAALKLPINIRGISFDFLSFSLAIEKIFQDSFRCAKTCQVARQLNQGMLSRQETAKPFKSTTQTPKVV